MGSAHFLTAALDMMADRIGLFLAEVEGLPEIVEQLGELKLYNESPTFQQTEDGDLLRRLILKRCIYGVDISPMAVEIANITLWLASFVPGLALSYLGSNLKCGDSLIGVADPTVVGGSDTPLFTGKAVKEAISEAVNIQRQLVDNPDRTPDEVKISEELDSSLQGATQKLRNAFDIWTAEPLGLDGARHVLETNTEAIINEMDYKSPDVHKIIETASIKGKKHLFFHWPLEFPSVFYRKQKGFDVVVGNPPWNEITVEELAFYALREPGLRGLLELKDMRKRIGELDKQNPELREEFELQKRKMATLRNFFTSEGGYDLQGVGDKDLYQLFCERYRHLVRENGYLGVVLPRQAFLAKGQQFPLKKKIQ